MAAGLRLKPTYEEIAKIVEEDPYRIALPNRLASRLRNSFELSQLDGEGLRAMEEYAVKQSKEAEKEQILRQMAANNDMPLSDLKAVVESVRERTDILGTTLQSNVEEQQLINEQMQEFAIERAQEVRAEKIASAAEEASDIPQLRGFAAELAERKQQDLARKLEAQEKELARRRAESLKRFQARSEGGRQAAITRETGLTASERKRLAKGKPLTEEEALSEMEDTGPQQFQMFTPRKDRSATPGKGSASKRTTKGSVKRTFDIRQLEGDTPPRPALTSESRPSGSASSSSAAAAPSRIGRMAIKDFDRRTRERAKTAQASALQSRASEALASAAASDVPQGMAFFPILDESESVEKKRKSKSLRGKRG